MDDSCLWSCGFCRVPLLNSEAITKHIEECDHVGPLVLALPGLDERTGSIRYQKITFETNVEDIKKAIHAGYGLIFYPESGRISFSNLEHESTTILDYTLPGETFFSTASEKKLFQ